MNIIGYILIGGLVLNALFLIVALIIEKNFDEDSAIKKWWRKQVISIDPNYDEVDRVLDENGE